MTPHRPLMPCTEIARFDGRFYEVETRAFLEQCAVADICRQYGIKPKLVSQEIERLLKIYWFLQERPLAEDKKED